MRRLSAAAGLLGVLALVAGCGGRVVTAGEVTLLVSARTGAGMDALGAGPLSGVTVPASCARLDVFLAH